MKRKDPGERYAAAAQERRETHDAVKGLTFAVAVANGSTMRSAYAVATKAADYFVKRQDGAAQRAERDE